MAGNCITDDGACREAACQEIVRRYYDVLSDRRQGRGGDDPVYKLELLMQQAGITPAIRPVVDQANRLEEETGEPAMAIQLPDGRMVTGKTSELMGCSAAAQLSRRVAVLRALLGALEGMEREIAFRLTPMPELLERAAAESPPPVCTLFARCRTLLDELGERSMAELWREALEQVPLGLDGPGRLALEELGEVLGRYDGDGQREALAHTRAELSRALEQAREAREKQGRMYQVLGITAGAFLVILLL